MSDDYESEHVNWLCEDNPDANYNECGVGVGQELTNAQTAAMFNKVWSSNCVVVAHSICSCSLSTLLL